MNLGRSTSTVSESYTQIDFVWALQTVCAVHKKPFDAALLLQQFPPPYDEAALVRAAQALGFRSQLRDVPLEQLAQLPLPLLVELTSKPQNKDPADPADSTVTDILPASPGLALLVAISNDQVVWLPTNTQTPITQSVDEFSATLTGRVYLLYPQDEALRDPDAAQGTGHSVAGARLTTVHAGHY